MVEGCSSPVILQQVPVVWSTKLQVEISLEALVTIIILSKKLEGMGIQNSDPIFYSPVYYQLLHQDLAIDK